VTQRFFGKAIVMNFFTHIEQRGLTHNWTPNISNYLNECQKNSIIPKAYCGFDPSGRSLQVGNLMAILLLRRGQLNGVQPLALLGGATGLIGDPSGKKAERNLLNKNQAEENLECIKKQISHFIDMSPGKFQGQFVNNYDWFKNYNFIEFLRDVGKHITINYMIAKDSVKLRMETGISYAEFGYMLMQGYDFLHLYESHGCLMQIGGSDQWGNITTGIELIRRKHAVEAHAVSSPLLVDSAGNKLGKTEGGAIYLDPEMTSPFQFFQYWFQKADSEVLGIMNALTLLTSDQIDECKVSIANAPEKRHAQKTLAYTLTQMVHGENTAKAVAQASLVLFSKDEESLEGLNSQGLSTLVSEVPSTLVETLNGLSLLDLLVNTKLCLSKSEARRNIQGGAISLNRSKVSDDKLLLSDELFKNKKFILLGLGKSKLHLIVKK
jgi:tyrosyl-tRNA synthetase